MMNFLDTAKQQAFDLPDAVAEMIMEKLTTGRVPGLVADDLGLRRIVVQAFIRFDPRYAAMKQFIKECQDDGMAADALRKSDETVTDAFVGKQIENGIKARQWYLERTSETYSPKKEIKGDVTLSHADLFKK